MAEHEDRIAYLNQKRSRIDLGGVNAHDSIYKYVSLETKTSWNRFEQMLDDSELIGATVSSLNDPLEADARIINDLNIDMYDECCRYFDRSGVLRDHRNFSDFIEFKNLVSHVEKRLEKTTENARIIAFARRLDSHLLWSHYANAHKGACFHFSIDAFREPSITVGAVNYTLYKPVIPTSLLARIALPPAKSHHPEDRKKLRADLYRSLFYTKPMDWAYEEEVRITYSAAQMTNVPFEKAGLYEIILGARCSGDDRERIEGLLEKYPRPLKIRQAKIEPDTFSVGLI